MPPKKVKLDQVNLGFGYDDFTYTYKVKDQLLVIIYDDTLCVSLEVIINDQFQVTNDINN